MVKELQLLGLTETEAIIYEALVDLGPCKASALIARLDIHRNIIYRTLDALAQNGYVTKIIRNGVWWFQISDPQSLLISAHRKELVFAELIKEIQERHLRTSSQIVVYEGLTSYRNFWVQSLDRVPDGAVDYVAGGEVTRWSALMGKALGDYMAKAAKKNIRWKQLYFAMPDEEEKNILRGMTLPSERRVSDPAGGDFSGNFNIIGDTVILHTFSEEMPKVVEIRDKALVRTFQGIFDLMWAAAKPFEV